MLHALLLYRLDVLCFVALAAGGMAAVHVWLRRRGTAGVRPAAWTALVVLVAGAAAVAEHNGRLEADRLRDTLEGFAPTYAQELERMGHARVSWDTPPDDPEYVAMIDAQSRWLRANRVISDVYTFRLRESADGRGHDEIDGRFLGKVKDPQRLARRMYRFCPDIVDQGVGTVAALAKSLKEDKPQLYFWWD